VADVTFTDDIVTVRDHEFHFAGGPVAGLHPAVSSAVRPSARTVRVAPGRCEKTLCLTHAAP
jgi:hypothetical protein